MEHIHSIIIVKNKDKYLNYFDKRWQMYLFPNIKGNDIGKIKEKYNTNNVKFLFDKIHNKYSVSDKKIKTYHHYFFEVDEEIDGEYFSLDELLNKENVKKYNEDIIEYIRAYYKKKSL